jgi:dipeptidase E
MSKLLLLSNSTMPGTPFFTWPRPYVKNFLGIVPNPGVFVPFAAVTFSFQEYANVVENAFLEMGYQVKSLHGYEDRRKAIREAAFLVVGGGNTFALLSRLQEEDLLDEIQSRVKAGVPYIGWSAGANLACPTIMTTNDMPVVQPRSLKALALIPFQLNPHYHELKFEGQGGETRRERLEEFLMMNPEKRVLGLPEGMLVEKLDNQWILKGTGQAKYYSFGKEIQGIEPGTDITDL